MCLKFSFIFTALNMWANQWQGGGGGGGGGWPIQQSHFQAMPHEQGKYDRVVNGNQNITKSSTHIKMFTLEWNH